MSKPAILETAAAYEQLVQSLQEHDRRYYVDNDPSIADVEYDLLRKQLEATEAALLAPCPLLSAPRPLRPYALCPLLYALCQTVAISNRIRFILAPTKTKR